MKQFYTVAGNTFAITLPDHLAAWGPLRCRYLPFASTAGTTDSLVLEIEVRVAPMTECDAETIYQPAHTGIGDIAGRASRLPDGSLLIEFRHMSGMEPRLRLQISPELNRAVIVLRPGGESDDHYFLTHALMIAYLFATCGNGTMLIHASAVLYRGRAYLFQGRSGTGKSTHTGLWTRHIAGAELLNDDHPLLRFAPDGTAMAYGSPWSGKTDCYRNLSAPVGALVRIVRAPVNDLRPLTPLQAYASLTASVFYLPLFSDRLRTVRHNVIERLVRSVPCCEMHCLPDAEAPLVCLKGLSDYPETQNELQ